MYNYICTSAAYFFFYFQVGGVLALFVCAIFFYPFLDLFSVAVHIPFRAKYDSQRILGR